MLLTPAGQRSIEGAGAGTGGKTITDKFVPLINKDINDDTVKKKQDSVEKALERDLVRREMFRRQFYITPLCEICAILASSWSPVRAASGLKKQNVF